MFAEEPVNSIIRTEVTVHQYILQNVLPPLKLQSVIMQRTSAYNLCECSCMQFVVA